MRITRRRVTIGAIFAGLAGLALLKGCQDDPYPDIAVAFNTHGEGFAARHMDIQQAKATAMRDCTNAIRPGCDIKRAFKGTLQFCVSYGVYMAAPNMIVTTTVLPYPRGGNPDLAFDKCNENDDNVCRPGDFDHLCNF